MPIRNLFGNDRVKLAITQQNQSLARLQRSRADGPERQRTPKNEIAAIHVACAPDMPASASRKGVNNLSIKKINSRADVKVTMPAKLCK